MSIYSLSVGGVIAACENETSHHRTIVTLVSSTIGIALSILAFTALIITAVLFAEWRQNYKNQLIIQFMLARIMYTIMRYTYDIRNIFNICDFKCVIHLDVLGLMYTECALVSWMFVFSKHMHDSLVKVFNVPKTSMWKVSFFSWVVPGFISGLLYLSYSMQNGRDITVFLMYLFLLKWPVLCANAILLTQALLAILNTNQSRTESNVRIIVVMIVLIFVFSFQQILVDTYKIVHLLILDECVTFYLTVLNILAIYHCAFSITFWVFGNGNTRNLWKHRNVKLTSQLSVRSNQVMM